ncbi:helix-turn-helix domain-containing protein [Leucobacter chromiireducens]|uniref:XRE family transcriptional regulator n=1 Tax=Leucobacter chromiireducens subsp. solipictus TaxID=398235 RepID=A0ABS1SDW2_9MICO|nr:XRE family transcriptional regulator [Leucobacter chromiireducens]MBL3678731.1 XRE family transcriptional regulator [Leucobacter chromiireducens subsp. solipictus]
MTERSTTVRQPHTGASEQLAQIGFRLRVAREERGMTISSVADFTGLTKGFISQVERGLASASISSLAAICDALTMPMGRLFDPPKIYVNRLAERKPAMLMGDGVADTILTPPGQSDVQVIETWVEPGGGFEPEPYRLPVDREFVVVLAGELELRIEAETFLLAEGDTMSFDARHAHIWRNPSETERTRVMWVLSSRV